MRCEARHSPEAEYTVWWLLLCRAVERAARAAAFREAADLCERWSDKWRPDVPVRDRYADGLSSGASELADALRARAEGGGEGGR